MTNYATGHLAEKYAVEYLEDQGYKIVATNWRTKYCEIDIIAQRDKTIYFIEVKYRKHGTHGTGLDYITSRKLKQMRFAAELWVSEQQWQGPYSLAAIEMSGTDFKIGKFVEGFL